MALANIISATHTWNTQTGSVSNATGIDVSVWQNRFVAPYLDFVPLVCRGCAITTITDGFFLGGAQVRNHYQGVCASGFVYYSLLSEPGHADHLQT